MSWLGLDIGGANLKAASTSGWTRSLPFSLWRTPEGLVAALATLVEGATANASFAVTMTGELCDCFRTKEEGVHCILSAVESIALGRQISVFLVDGRFVNIAVARESFQLAAASNWRALAEFACRYISGGPGLLVDVGSTTCDIIPIVEGRVAATGSNDTERLAARELIYSGAGRTPVCAIVNALPWRGGECPVAAEIFATTADAYVLLGKVAVELDATWTADGRPLTPEYARQRLARQICADAVDLSPDEVICMARGVYDAQIRQLTNGVVAVVGRMPHPPKLVLVSGSGEFLAQAAVEAALPDQTVTASLATRLGPEISRCAPAYAVAVLAQETAEESDHERD